MATYSISDQSCTHYTHHPHIDLVAAGYTSDSVCTTNTTAGSDSGEVGELWCTLGASYPILHMIYVSGTTYFYFDPDYNATGGSDSLAARNWAWGYNGSQAVILVSDSQDYGYNDPWWAWDMNDRGYTHHP